MTDLQLELQLSYLIVIACSMAIFIGFRTGLEFAK